MTIKIFIYIVLIWLLFLGADMANQFLENYIASPGLGEYKGHIFSVLRLWGVVIIVICIFVNSLNMTYFSKSDLMFIGIFWIVLNFLFIIFYSYYNRRIPLGILLEDYDIREGRLKAFILLTELIAPYLLGTWRYFTTRRAR